MPILIHLNGPPGVGKSTLAQRYVNEHPGALNLDIDTVASLIGGWREDFFGVLEAARNVAIAMAGAHLRTGCNVVMPQLVTSVDEAERFSLAAKRVRAAYFEIALTVDPAEQVERFSVKATHSKLNTHIDGVVADTGGDELLSPDPRVDEGGGRAVTCRCPSCVEDCSCDGRILGRPKGHLTGASMP